MPAFIHERAKHILAKNPDMPTSEAFGIATQQSHALGKTPKNYGTVEGRKKAKRKYKKPKNMVKTPNPGKLQTQKLASEGLPRMSPDAISERNRRDLEKAAFVEALPVITGLASGYSPGKNIAGETAAAVAPHGRVHRSENIARNAAAIGVPLGGLAAMAAAHHYRLAPRLADFAAHHFPKGLISEPESERELIRQLLPGAAAIGGSLLGGAATGGAVGGLQQLRGPTHTHKTAAAPKDGKKPVRVEGAGRLAGKALLGTYGGMGATMGLGHLMGQNLNSEVSSPGSRELFDKVLGGASVPVHEAPYVPGGMFIPGNTKQAPMLHSAWGSKARDAAELLKPHVVVQSKSPSVLAHELGHAAIDKSRLGKLVQNKLTMRAPMLGGTAGFLGGLATGGSEDESTRNLGMASGALLHLPQLLYEGGASIKGYRNLKRLGATAEQLSHARGVMLPAFGTYAGTAGMSLAAGALGSAIGRAWGNKSRRHDLADERAQARHAALQPTKEATVKAVEKEDAAAGDETDPQIAKAAFNTNQYSGVMNPAPMQYQSGIPSWGEPPVKTAGPPSEAGPKKLKVASNAAELEQEGTSELRRFAKPLINLADDVRPLIVRRLNSGEAEKTAEGQPDTVLEHVHRNAYRGAVLGSIAGPLAGAALAGKGSRLDGAIIGALLGSSVGAFGGGIHGAVAHRKEASVVSPNHQLSSSQSVGSPKMSTPPGPSIAQISKPTGYGRPISGAAKGNHII